MYREGALACRRLVRECSGSGLLRQFRAEDLDSFDDRRRREQVGRLCHQRLRNRSIEMGLPPSFILEGVKDAER